MTLLLALHKAMDLRLAEFGNVPTSFLDAAPFVSLINRLFLIATFSCGFTLLLSSNA